jgi:hypothetical protein
MGYIPNHPRLYTKLPKHIYKFASMDFLIGCRIYNTNKLDTEILVPMPYFIREFGISINRTIQVVLIVPHVQVVLQVCFQRSNMQ